MFQVLIRGEEGDTSQMGVSYEVRIHIADSIDDYDGSKKNTVCMNIRKVSTTLVMYLEIEFKCWWDYKFWVQYDF